MQVNSINGEPLRFHVTSQTRSERLHLVDLEEWGGFGVCSCETFTYRTQPKVFKGEKKKGYGTDCKHIIAAKVFFAQKIVREIIQVRKEAGALAKSKRDGLLCQKATAASKPDF